MSATVAKVPECGRALKLEAGARMYWRGNRYDPPAEIASVRGLRLIAGLTSLFSLALAPSPIRASIIGIPITSNGYTFTNFDPPLTGTAVGSNANGISNTGHVVGTTVDVNNASTFTNYTGTPATTTSLNTGADQIAFGINSAGDVVGGNGVNAFFLPNGGSPVNLTTPGGAINAFGINDKGNIVGQFSSGGKILPGSCWTAALVVLSPRSTSPTVLQRTSSTPRGSITTA